jgi:hypothetical protein
MCHRPDQCVRRYGPCSFAETSAVTSTAGQLCSHSGVVPHPDRSLPLSGRHNKGEHPTSPQRRIEKDLAVTGVMAPILGKYLDRILNIGRLPMRRRGGCRSYSQQQYDQDDQEDWLGRPPMVDRGYLRGRLATDQVCFIGCGGESRRCAMLVGTRIGAVGPPAELIAFGVGRRRGRFPAE